MISVKEYMSYSVRAKGVFYSKYKTSPLYLDLIENTKEYIKFKARGKDLLNNEINITITFKK
ncbi:MAG: hypothetical protein SOV85_01880 [Clostridium sp.]|uniref:hypothetical protein n=1 Tax=Clostridium sp. TaxID=1506 RepID=UPI002A74E9AA|nr:hypothetical protein [Clostridium sp.]MDY2630093.1 hypothetical protein [Clostridium sp.]